MELDELVLGCLKFDGPWLDYMEPGGLGLFDLNLQVEQRLNCPMFDGLKLDCMELGGLGQHGLNLLGMVLAGRGLDY